jgi:hypothetical protein
VPKNEEYRSVSLLEIVRRDINMDWAKDNPYVQFQMVADMYYVRIGSPADSFLRLLGI